MLTAVGLSQVIQLPISIVATVGNSYNGRLDTTLGGLLAAGVTAGIWAGSKIAFGLPRAALRRVVAILLISIGGLILAKLAAGLFG